MDENLSQYALFYHGFGFNVTHILPEKQINKDGEFEYVLKKPSHSIDNLLSKRQSEEDVLSFNWENATGVGAVMGFNELRSIDIDGCTNEIFLYEFLRIIGLPNNYEWVVRTGSHNGFQIIFYAESHNWLSHLTPKSGIISMYAQKEYLPQFKHIELMWTNHVVLPPSLHISGKKYEFLSGNKPLNPPAQIDTYPIAKHLAEICQPQSPIDETGHFCDNFLSDDFAFISYLDSSGYKTGAYKEPFYFFIDVETNGLPENYSDPEINPEAYPEIIQIATLCCDSDGKLISRRNKYIIPDGWEINEDIKRLINLDEEKMHYEGIYLRKRNEEEIPYYSLSSYDNKYYVNFEGTYEVVMNAHLNSLFWLLRPESAWYNETPVRYIVGHNIEYDLNCLKALFGRNKKRAECEIFNQLLDKYFLRRIQNMKTICTMKSSTEFCGILNEYGVKYPKLEELHFKLFKTHFKGVHDATEDVYNTAKCYWKLRDLKQIE